MNPIAHRLSLVRRQFGLNSRARMAAKLGLPTSTYAAYEGEDGPPKLDWLQLLLGWGVNINWLLSGRGAMLVETEQRSTPPPARPVVPGLDEILLAAMIRTVERKEQESGRTFGAVEKGSMVARLYAVAHGAAERELSMHVDGYIDGHLDGGMPLD